MTNFTASSHGASILQDAASCSAEKLLEQAQKLKQLNSWFEVALNNMARGLSMFDAERRLVVCNALYAEIYDLPDHLTKPGTHFSELVSYYVAREGRHKDETSKLEQQQWIEKHAAELMRGKTFTHTQHLNNGRIILVTNQPLMDGGWVDIQEDVTEKTLASERITWLAQHCPLTETANRFHLRERLDEEIRRLNGGGMIAVHLIDLDRFKVVNDTHGHAAGDALLKAVARRMQATVRAEDIVGRLGGDEFAVVQTGIDNPEQAKSLASRLLRVLNAPYRVLGNGASVGASIGLAISPEHGLDADTLLRKADIALYRVKSGGRGQFNLFKNEDEDAAIAQMRIESDLKHALALNQLELHYQPILDVRTHKVTGCEALMRWKHPELGMISPATFIPIAEKSDIILELGTWALGQACADAATWTTPCKVIVNLSAVQFQKGDPSEVAQRALEAAGLPPERLDVEITESVILKGDKRTKAGLEKLRELGVRVALDDFGTAFASLSYLREFAFDKIKIDRSFVRDVGDRRDCIAIVNAVAGLAKALEIGSVAEGIETADQLEKVSTAGCQEVQGFFFSPAVPSAELEAALESCAAQWKRSVPNSI